MDIIQTIDTIKKEIPHINKKPYSHNIIGMYLNKLQEQLHGDEDKFQMLIHLHLYQLYNLGWEHIFKVGDKNI